MNFDRSVKANLRVLRHTSSSASHINHLVKEKVII